MKKLLSILLLLCMLLPISLGESSNVYVAESHIREYTEGDTTHLHVVFVIENRGSTTLLPNATAVVLMNEKGEIIAEKLSTLYPMVIAAGGRGYVHGVFQLDAQMKAQYDHPELYLGLSQYSDDEQQMVDDISKALVYPAIISEVSDSTVALTITNNTPIDIAVGGVLILYRNEAGDIVGVTEDFVTNLPMGESTQITHEFTLAPFTAVETVCYSMPM